MPRSGSPAYYVALIALAGIPLFGLLYAALDPAVNSIISNTSVLSSGQNPAYVQTGQRRVVDIWEYLPMIALVAWVFAGIIVSRRAL